MRVYGREAFAAQRRGDQDEMEKVLFPYVAQAMKRWPADDWYNELLAEVGRQYLSVFHTEGGTGEPRPPVTDFLADVRATLDKTDSPNATTVDRVSVWLSTAILNAGTQAAAATDEEFLVMEWVTMHDDKVRDAHTVADGQTRPPGEPFDVCGTTMRYPGDPTGPLDCWMNCRCALAPTLGSEAERFAEGGTTMTANTTEPETQPTTDEAQPVAQQIPWHGVLAPEGKWSGDGRRFADGALTTRDLPMPMTWQKETSDGHDGSVVVAKIEQVQRVEGEMRAVGHFLTIPEADEVIGLLADFGRFGVSVDADDAEFEYDENSNQVTFTSARISSASIVSIPAFAEAWVGLGEPPDGFWPAEFSSTEVVTFVSDKPWSDFTAADYTDDQWYAACCLHRNGSSRSKSDNGLPIKEPGGALNRNGVHAAAGRFGQTQGPAEAKAAAKACLRGAYKTLGEEPPDSLKADGRVWDFTVPATTWTTNTVTWGRGPGWITNPEDTRRIHDYWTVPGHEGYTKIGWGTPGDFDRCRVEVGQEIAENSPEKVRFINQICSQWHHDATGFWPGNAPAERVASGEPAPAVSLVASGGPKAPAAWFTDPGLDRVTHLTVTEEGRVFGHLAEWDVCHIGYDGVCVVAPHSESDYAYFASKSVLLDDGTSARTGVISLGGGHAGRGGVRATTDHYDSTSTAVADVCVGEDEHGIWCAGWVRPGVTDEQVVALRASDVSGDWREVGGGLELVAALAVNVAGLPVVSVSDGIQVALVAAGVVQSNEDRDQVQVLADAIVAAMERSQRETVDRMKRMGELIQRVRGGQ
jgi:hypothetical protein